ncbi:MAG: protein kinase [Deltaproteobacteria bacterium]
MHDVEYFGRYALLKRIGLGATGDVHIARVLEPEPGWPSVVVVKRMHADLVDQERVRQRFAHEARLALKIDCAHVARVYDAGLVDRTPYIAMEYVAGWTLARLFEELAKADIRMTFQAAAEIGLDILAGLAAIHTAALDDGTPLLAVHRDLSPRNIVLGEDAHARIIDLGLGRSVMQQWRTAPGVVMGSPGYMAPEQVFGEATDQRTDVYLAGLILWELATQEPFVKTEASGNRVLACAAPPWRAPSSVRPELPAALDTVLAKALAHDAAQRFTNAAEFERALARIAGERKAPGAAWFLAGQLLWEELAASKSEVTDLGRLDLGHTKLSQPKVPVEVPADPTFENTPALLQTPLPERREKSRAGRVALQIALLAGAVGGGMVLQDELTQPAPVEAPPMAVSPQPAAPGITPRPTPVAAVAPEPKAPAEVTPEPARKARTEPKRIRSRPRPAPPPPEAEPPPPPPKERVALPTATKRLLTRARGLQTAGADALVAEINNLFTYQGQQDVWARELERLEREVAAQERR